MPITKSAKKSLRKNERKSQLNSMHKKRVKDLSKKALSLIDQNKKEEAEKLLPQAYKVIDKAAKKNVIKKNTASRKKSRLAGLISKKS